MKKVLLLLIIPILSVLISCSGLLWNGDNSDELTISIANPFYQGSTSSQQSSRALALQGKYIYIELARIDDSVAYDADSNLPLSGDGAWTETDWGGQAIVTQTFELTNSIDINGTFTDVPRDQELLARVFLVDNQIDFETSISLDELFPICQTYAEGGTGVWGDSEIIIGVDALENGIINLPIRPRNLDQPVWSASLNLSEDYWGSPPTKPAVGATSFTEINPDISTLNLRDIGYYSIVSGECIGSDGSMRSISILHESSGSPFLSTLPTILPVANVAGTGFPGFSFNSLQVQAVTLPDYSTPGYFMSSTLFTDPAGGISGDSWIISYGVLYDTAIDAGDSNGLYVYWSVPDGFSSGDLDFAIINLDPTGITDEKDIETIDLINEKTVNLDPVWSDPLVIWQGDNSYSYVNIDFHPNEGSWIIILAKKPGGIPFIYGRVQVFLT